MLCGGSSRGLSMPCRRESRNFAVTPSPKSNETLRGDGLVAAAVEVVGLFFVFEGVGFDVNEDSAFPQ